MGYKGIQWYSTITISLPRVAYAYGLIGLSSLACVPHGAFNSPLRTDSKARVHTPDSTASSLPAELSHLLPQSDYDNAASEGGITPETEQFSATNTQTTPLAFPLSQYKNLLTAGAVAVEVGLVIDFARATFAHEYQQRLRNAVQQNASVANLCELYMEARRKGIDLNGVTPHYPYRLLFFTNSFFDEVRYSAARNRRILTGRRDSYVQLFDQHAPQEGVNCAALQCNVMALKAWAQGMVDLLHEPQQQHKAVLDMLLHNNPAASIHTYSRLHLALGLQAVDHRPRIARLQFLDTDHQVRALPHVAESCYLVLTYSDGREFKSAFATYHKGALFFKFPLSPEHVRNVTSTYHHPQFFMANPRYALSRFWAVVGQTSVAVTLCDMSKGRARLIPNAHESTRLWVAHTLGVYHDNSAMQFQDLQPLSWTCDETSNEAVIRAATSDWPVHPFSPT